MNTPRASDVRFAAMVLFAVGLVWVVAERVGGVFDQNDGVRTSGEVASDIGEAPGATKQLFQRPEPINPQLPFPANSAPKKPAEGNPQDLQPPEIPAIKQRSQREQRGSSFVKWSMLGERLDAAAPHWQCAEDRRTGLLWEVRSFDGGMRDAEHTYSWYQPGSATFSGVANGGRCFRIDCDTQSYIETVNAEKLCGRENWRLPKFAELEGLIDRDYYNPTINQAIFPNALGKVYWTSTELGNNPELVMQVDFFNGISSAVMKRHPYWLRLVSSPESEAAANPFTPAASAPAQTAPLPPAE